VAQERKRRPDRRRRQLTSAGGEIGGTGPIAIAWCIAITLVGYLWARTMFKRDPALGGKSREPWCDELMAVSIGYSKSAPT